MTYQEAIDYLYIKLPQFQLVGAGAYKPGLENAERLDEWAGHPHRRFKTIHVAGTNGKGSVSHLLASILQSAGYRVGLFTSPHLKDFRERIRVNGEMITKRAVSRFMQAYCREFDAPATPEFSRLAPSFFELTTTMAFDYFARSQVDVAVIEVGLGGRLDSTNIIRPELSVLTSISFDHMAILGDALEKIAGEKAGIIKAGIPVVVGHNRPEVVEVFRQKAESLASPCVLADDTFRLEAEESFPGQLLQVTALNDGRSHYPSLFCALGGFYIRENALTVLTAVEQLRRSMEIPDAAVYEGFRDVVAKTGLRGRWEVLRRHPLCICDTGHNEDGIRYVVSQLRATPHEQLHIVFGMVSDKDVTHVLQLMPQEAVYYFTKAPVQRAMPETELAEKAAAFGLKGQCFATVPEALSAAMSAASDNDLIYVGGSNFVVAEVI